MRLKWLLIISCFCITTSFGQYRSSRVSTVPIYGGNGYGGTSIIQPGYSSAVLNRPVGSIYYTPGSIYSPNAPGYTTWQVTPGVNTYNSLHIPRAASAPLLPSHRVLIPPAASSLLLPSHRGLSSIPVVQKLNTMHVPRAASAPPLSSILVQPTYVSPTSNTIPAQTSNSIPASIPREQILKTVNRPNKMLLLPSSRKMQLNPNNNIDSQTSASSNEYQLSLRPDTRSVSQPSGRPLRQAGYASPVVNPVERPQSLDGNYEDIPATDDNNWHAEYDGTYWDSATNQNTPHISTKILSFFMATLMILYFC